ncbi:MAG: hypothetical protein J6J36_07955 [Clostridia bacterium]|nr:hypothetical protein [Clostridia bacterium]
MAKEKNYKVIGNEIHAVILKLTEKETKEVKKYMDLGFKLVVKEPVVKTKEEKAEEQKANPYSKENVEAFLKSLDDKSYWTTYEARYNEQAGTNRMQKNKKTGKVEKIADEPKYLKSGEPKKKGFANCIGWFKENFEYDAAAKKYVSVKNK